MILYPDFFLKMLGDFGNLMIRGFDQINLGNGDFGLEFGMGL